MLEISSVIAQGDVEKKVPHSRSTTGTNNSLFNFGIKRLNSQKSQAARSKKTTISKFSMRSYFSNFSAVNKENFLKFGRSKVTFLFFNAMFTFFGCALTIFSISTWLNNYYDAVLYKAISIVFLILLTVVSTLMALTGLIGFLGAFSHKKFILTFFVILNIPVFAGWVTLGYLTFKEVNSSEFEINISNQWNSYNAEKNLIQSKYGCCGYLSHFDRPFVNGRCHGFTNSENSILTKREVNGDVEKKPFQVVSTPACHNEWSRFVSKYLRFILYQNMLQCIIYSCTFHASKL
ncbi:hypothetical protein HDU92_007472 [Lobulomyces angularis]|nr:hypothetical protein HDU92_007472 [Lobulomyces angularis]